MFSSLRTRLWLSYALMIATALTVVAVVLLLYLIRNPLLYRQTLERLRVAQGLILERPNEILDPGNPAALERLTQTLDVRVLVFTSDLSLRMDTQAAEPALPFSRRPALLRNAPSVEDAAGRSWLYTATRLPEGGWLMVAAPRPRVPILNVITDELLVPMSQGALVALVLSLLLAFLISRWIADPLQRLVAAARAIPSEETQAIPERGPREVREVTRAFNAMVARMQGNRRSQREFVANVSHELKTPLTSIQGFAQAILDGTAASPEDRRQAAEVIQVESARMHRMVLDLLDLARLESGIADLTRSPVDVGALLNAVAGKFKPQAGKAGIALEVDLSPDLPALVADGDRLAQVFTNLVDNALKHTPPGGRIILRARLAGPQMTFEVQDNGEGIPAESLGRIFDRFYQADPSRTRGERHGAGLGLAIVREIVQAHGGRISVRSQSGRGTTFILNLPISNLAASAVTHPRL